MSAWTERSSELRQLLWNRGLLAITDCPGEEVEAVACELIKQLQAQLLEFGAAIALNESLQTQLTKAQEKIDLLVKRKDAVWPEEARKAVDDLENKYDISICSSEFTEDWMDRWERTNILLNPRFWTKEMSDAWHQNIPDLMKAFEALRNIKESS